jgi:arginine-tRNA-protein transferase
MDTPKSAPNAHARRSGEFAGQWTFHVLRENPCPYLPERLERKLMTRIEGEDATPFYTLLSQSGFRRSHIFAYRPACQGCSACVPVRVKVPRFRPSSTQRRLIRMNGDLTAREVAAIATDEHYRLFQSYVEARHQDGEMADMRFEDYRGMIEDTHLDTRLSEYRLPSGELAAVCLTDWLGDGGSAVYSFFDPELSKRSLGTWMILDLIEAAHRRGLAHVYLGYWIDNAPKMAYKERFRPLEGLGPEGWRVIAP